MCRWRPTSSRKTSEWTTFSRLFPSLSLWDSFWWSIMRQIMAAWPKNKLIASKKKTDAFVNWTMATTCCFVVMFSWFGGGFTFARRVLMNFLPSNCPVRRSLWRQRKEFRVCCGISNWTDDVNWEKRWGIDSIWPFCEQTQTVLSAICHSR